MDFSKVKFVHFIGIGGIGVSAIARYFLAQGARVSGSDRARSEITEALEKEGARITFSEQGIDEIPKNVELIVYSVALEVAEPKFIAEVKKLSVPALSYSEALGEISRGKRTIAVSGTHGKTTTAAMIATVLIDAGLEPTVIIGSLFLAFPQGPTLNRKKGRTLGTNYVAGKGDWFVVEADEYRRSFLSLSPEVLVVTNIDRDHLDYFKDLSDIRSAYAELAAKVPKEGVIVMDFADEHIGLAVKAAKAPILDYASVSTEGLRLKFPGAHNIANAQAALTVASFLGIDRGKAVQSLNNFQGTWRRFEHLGETECGAFVYDDYAHNPAKIRALLQGVKERFPQCRVIAIFQPHLYSRTKHLLHEFAASFDKADLIILAPIFPAREKPDPSISSEILAEAIAKASGKPMVLFSSFQKIAAYVDAVAGKSDIVLTIGAGDIYKVADMLVPALPPRRQS